MEEGVERKIISLWEQMYSFPREFGNPKRKLLSSIEEFIKEFRNNNGKRDIFLALYSFEDQEFKKPVVDRLFLDFDTDDEAKLPQVWEEVKTIATKLRERSIEPLVVFSGKKGFHVYIFFPPVNLNSPKQTLAKFAEALLQNVLGRDPLFLDWKIVGDLRRLSRVPYSIHPETERYVTVLDRYDFTIEEILKLSEQLYVPQVSIKRSEAVARALEFLDSTLTLGEAERSDEVVEKIELTLGNRVEGIVYLALPCIRALFQSKLPPGQRRAKAAKYIAIAYYFDHGGDMTGFEEVAKRFSEIQDLGHRLKFSEVVGWKRGIYQLNDGMGPTWNCTEIRRYLSEVNLHVKCSVCDLNKHFLIETIKKRSKTAQDHLKMLKDCNLLERVQKVLDHYVVGEEANKLLLFLLLLRSQNVIVKGPPSTGKTTLVESVLKLFPEEDIVVVSGATKKFLRWMEKDHISILYLKEAPKDLLEEVKGEGLAIDIKLAMSDKILRILAVDSTQKKTIEKRIKIDSVVMTALDIDLPQDVETRVWILAPDISPSQTKRVLEWKALRKMQPFNDIDTEIKLIRQLVRELKRDFEIVIPFADIVADAVASISLLPRARRDIDKIFLLLEAIAVARGKIYWCKDREIVVPDEEDLKLVLQFSNIFVEMLSGYDPFTITVYNALKELSALFPTLTPQIVSENLDIPQSLAEQYLERLVNVGLAIKSREGLNYIYKLKDLKMKSLQIDLQSAKERVEKYLRENGCRADL